MKAILLTVFLHSVTAYAGGDKVGGGGDVVICSKSSTPYRLLDSLEAELPRHEGGVMRMNLGGPKMSMIEKINLMHDRLAQFDAIRAADYRAEVLKIVADLQASKAKVKSPFGLATRWGHLPDVDDANENFFVPVGCTKEQLVKQDDPIDATDWTYRFVGEYLDRLSSDEFVATLYHEAIYKVFRTFGHEHSRYVRHLNAWLFSGAITSMTPQRYFEFTHQVGFATVTLAGKVETEFPQVQFDDQGRVRGASSGRLLLAPNLTLKLSQIHFENGQLKSAVATAVPLGQTHAGWRIYESALVVNGKNEGGDFELEALGNGSYALRSAKRTLEISSEGRVLHHWSPEPYAKNITATDRTALEKVVRCIARTYSGKNAYVPPSEMHALLLKSLGQAQAQDTAGLVASAAACVELQKSSRVENAALTEKDFQAWRESYVKGDSKRDGPAWNLMLAITSSAYPVHCDIEGPAVGAAFLVGQEIGYIKARCVLSNGAVRRYIGPRVTLFTFGVGAHVSYDRYRIGDAEEAAHPLTARKIFAAPQADQSGARSGVGRIRHGTAPYERSNPVGYGAYGTIFNFGWNLGFRVGDRHDQDVSHLMLGLLQGDTDTFYEN